VAVAHLLEAAIVVLGDVEQVFANVARQLFNRTVVAIWDNRRDVHSMVRPFRSIIHVRREKTQRRCQPYIRRDLWWHPVQPLSIAVGNFPKWGLPVLSQHLLVDAQTFLQKKPFPSKPRAVHWYYYISEKSAFPSVLPRLEDVSGSFLSNRRPISQDYSRSSICWWQRYRCMLCQYQR